MNAVEKHITVLTDESFRIKRKKRKEYMFYPPDIVLIKLDENYKTAAHGSSTGYMYEIPKCGIMLVLDKGTHELLLHQEQLKGLQIECEYSMNPSIASPSVF